MIKREDGSGCVRIIDSIAVQKNIKCDDLAELLLGDILIVKGIREEDKENESFIRAVMRKWLDSPAVECTWENLIDCMECAGLDGVQDIKENILRVLTS